MSMPGAKPAHSQGYIAENREEVYRTSATVQPRHRAVAGVFDPTYREKLVQFCGAQCEETVGNVGVELKAIIDCMVDPGAVCT